MLAESCKSKRMFDNPNMEYTVQLSIINYPSDSNENKVPAVENKS